MFIVVGVVEWIVNWEPRVYIALFMFALYQSQKFSFQAVGQRVFFTTVVK